jgi:hypothetical protein
MTTELVEVGTGLELIQLEVGKVLYNEINEEIDAFQALWQIRDAEWQSLTGIGHNDIIVEYIEDKNFHLGHRPSLILNDTPKESYPNISVMAYQARPTDNIVDQATNYNNAIDIEVMTKSEESELEVDRRTHRTVEAVCQVLSRNSSLNGKSLGWDNEPIIQLTDIFARRENVSTGEQWFWQGARIRYNLDRNTLLV